MGAVGCVGVRGHTAAGRVGPFGSSRKTRPLHPPLVPNEALPPAGV